MQQQHYLITEYNSRNHICNLECFRPREMSSKQAVATESLAVPSRKTVPRDPRFDSLCGSFNEKVLFVVLIWYRSRIWVWRCLTSDDSQKPVFSSCLSARFISDGSYVVSWPDCSLTWPCYSRASGSKTSTKNVKYELRYYNHPCYTVCQFSFTLFIHLAITRWMGTINWHCLVNLSNMTTDNSSYSTNIIASLLEKDGRKVP